MNINKIFILLIIVLSLCISGCSSSFLSSKSETREKVILANKKMSLIDKNKSKIEKLVKHLRGSDYFNESEISSEYGENVISIEYGVNQKLGEGDYINFWNYTNKEEIIISNSVYLFLIIHDLDKVKIRLDNPINEEFIINRNDIEAVYEMALEDCGITEENINSLLSGEYIQKIWYSVNS